MYVVFNNDATAQIQQAWVARYNNGIINGTNQAIKMALDPSGNIYITGFSENTNTNLGYVTIKYAPNGIQLWAARFDSTNYPTATPTGLVLDNSNNVIVTGNPVTMKYDSTGNQLWSAPFSGTALAVDAGANVYVTGFGTAFNTVKLNSLGSNVWFTTYTDLGPTLSQIVLVDGATNVYVAGSDAYDYFGSASWFIVRLAIVKYTSIGSQLWTASYVSEGDPSGVQIEGAALDSANNLYFVADFSPIIPGPVFTTYKYGSNGSMLWSADNPTANGGSVAHGLALDAASNAFVTGADAHYYPNTPYPIGTYKIGPNGAYLWANLYYSIPIASSVGMSITLDQANSVYVTGYSPGTNSSNDIVTIEYDNNGNQIWVQRYHGPGSGDDAGNAIAVDKNGNVYVTGYEATAAGGTEIVTIKYSPVTLQRRADGTVLLRAQGSPGESFDFQGSTDLLNWLDLGSMVADSNGVAQFQDTNASNYNRRFYVTTPQ
jgi:hypothetical protein